MRSLLAIGCAATLLAIGCAPAGPNLNGTWTADNVKEMDGATMELTFSGSNAVKMNVKGEQMGLKINATADGTYTLTGEDLKLTFTTADLKFEGLTPDQEKMMEANKDAGNKQFLETINKDAGGKIKWVDNNTIDMTSGPSTVQLKRKA